MLEIEIRLTNQTATVITTGRSLDGLQLEVLEPQQVRWQTTEKPPIEVSFGNATGDILQQIVARRQLFTASAGQTGFTLSAAPEIPESTELFINGIKATYGTEYRIEGDRLLWLGTMPLEPSDEIEILT